ncbi:MAG: hypothetical protein K0S61_82 [Anaerocolumna sp.]|jgi:hypothetical protein|nr:hypothetical protein [Anaerocolumna sp.]
MTKKDIIDAGDYAQDAHAGIELDDRNKKLLKDSYPSNSIYKKEEKEEPKKVERVTQGKVITRKKSLSKRFMETFIADDIINVKDYIIKDVLVPSAKSTITDIAQGIFDAVQTGIEVALFGEAVRNRSRGNRNKSYVSYNSYSSNKRDDRREASSRNISRHTFDDIVLESYDEAEEVLGHLVDLITDYGQATVSDLYGLVGISSSFTDDKFGWDDLSRVRVSRARGGWQLNLPRAIPLD